MIKKAEKFTKVQLNSVDVSISVKAITKNAHFVLCNATYPTQNNREASIKIPVQFEKGFPLSSHFIDGENLVELNKTNIYTQKIQT